jgi:hypothetical protein
VLHPDMKSTTCGTRADGLGTQFSWCRLILQLESQQRPRQQWRQLPEESSTALIAAPLQAGMPHDELREKGPNLLPDVNPHYDPMPVLRK